MCIRYFIPLEFDLPALIYYSFDTATVSGSTLLNLGSGGAAYNAQLINSPAISSSDKMVGTGAMQFTSSLSQYVQIPSFTTGTSGLSFAFWFKFLYTGVHSRVFDFGNDAGSDNILFARWDGNEDIYISTFRRAARYSQTSLFEQNVNDNTWRHAVWTIDPSGNWVVYVNGNLLRSYGSVSYPNAVTRTLNYLGKSNWGRDAYLNGAIDEFYMFEYVLSADQVKELFYLGRNRVVFALPYYNRVSVHESDDTFILHSSYVILQLLLFGLSLTSLCFFSRLNSLRLEYLSHTGVFYWYDYETAINKWR